MLQLTWSRGKGLQFVPQPWSTMPHALACVIAWMMLSMTQTFRRAQPWHWRQKRSLKQSNYCYEVLSEDSFYHERTWEMWKKYSFGIRMFLVGQNFHSCKKARGKVFIKFKQLCSLQFCFVNPRKQESKRISGTIADVPISHMLKFYYFLISTIFQSQTLLLKTRSILPQIEEKRIQKSIMLDSEVLFQEAPVIKISSKFQH